MAITKKITIKNTSISADDFGLFGALIGYSNENRCIIKNLKLDVDFEVSNTFPKCFCGGLAGEIYEFVSIENVDVEGSIIGNRVTGGIVSTIRECDEGETVIIKDCDVKANINNYSLYNSDNWLCVGGIIGQSSCVNGTSVIDCSFVGKLSTDFTGYTSSASSYIGYVMAKGGQDCGDESTIITNFSVGEGSSIEGYQNVDTHGYPFEGLNKYTGTNTYTGTANRNKELLGGYFYKCTIDGVTTGGSGQNFYPHG